MGILMASFLPSPAHAIPAFARKHDLSCTACHTKPPRLNAFGEAFHMAGFQIPMVEEGETKKKRRIGRIWSETDLLNIFSLRATGNLVEAFSGSPSETNLAFPQEVEVYLAGTMTQRISYFFTLEHEAGAIEGGPGGAFEERSRFGLGKEFFFMFDLGPSMKDAPHGGARDLMIMGPMVMVGKIDPSTNFSYPTNRQIVQNAPGRLRAGNMTRFALAPYAFASKFFGVKTATGEPIEVTTESLYNTSGDAGVDVHGMVGRVMIQTGVMQGLSAGTRDVNEKKDPYLMARVNFGGERYLSGSLSGLLYWGNETAMVETQLVDWLRQGLSANVKYKLLDLYGAVIWDRVGNLSGTLSPRFDDTALGVTVEGDYLASDPVLLSARYDQLDAGGFINEKADGKLLTLQARYFVRDNVSFALRGSYNLEGVGSNPIRNFQHLVALAVDLDF